MAKSGTFVTCDSCEVEFRVISDTFYPIEFCPFCASELPSDEDDDEEEIDE